MSISIDCPVGVTKRRLLRFHVDEVISSAFACADAPNTNRLQSSGIKISFPCFPWVSSYWARSGRMTNPPRGHLTATAGASSRTARMSAAATRPLARRPDQRRASCRRREGVLNPPLLQCQPMIPGCARHPLCGARRSPCRWLTFHACFVPRRRLLQERLAPGTRGDSTLSAKC